jgi:hypothetical protein
MLHRDIASNARSGTVAVATKRLSPGRRAESERTSRRPAGSTQHAIATPTRLSIPAARTLHSTSLCRYGLYASSWSVTGRLQYRRSSEAASVVRMASSKEVPNVCDPCTAVAALAFSLAASLRECAQSRRRVSPGVAKMGIPERRKECPRRVAHRENAGPCSSRISGCLGLSRTS